MDSARLNSIARQTSISHTDLIYLFHHRDEFYLYFDATLEESEYFDSYFETSNFKRFMEAYSKGERFIPDQPNIDVLRVLHERQFDKAAEECLRQLKFLCSKNNPLLGKILRQATIEECLDPNTASWLAREFKSLGNSLENLYED